MTAPRPVTCSLALLLAACDPQPAAPPTPALSELELSDLQQLVQQGQVLADARDLQWRTAITAAQQAAAAMPDDPAPCPVDVGDASSIAAGQVLDEVNAFLEGLGTSTEHRKLDPHAVLEPDELAQASSPRSRMVLEELRWLADPAATGYDLPDPAARVEAARALASADAWTWDLTILPVVRQDAQGFDLDAGTFQGGLAAGRAFVYDYRQQAVVCRGSFLETSSARLSLRDGAGADGTAQHDRLKNLIEGAVRGLAATGAQAAQDGAQAVSSGQDPAPEETR